MTTTGVTYNHKNGHFWQMDFTGKELDPETGYSYFGARYLDHTPLTLWLSVDPMADKYPSISPYAYCAWNPLKLLDPDGEKVVFAGDNEKELYLKYRELIFSDNKYKAIQKELNRLEESNDVFCIRMGENVSNNEGAGNFTYNSIEGQFDINISNDRLLTDIEKISHELKHADQYLNRKLTFYISPEGLVTPENYSLDDEFEAYCRQGMFGNTLTPEEIYDRYPKLLYRGSNVVFSPTSEHIQNNTEFMKQKGFPCHLYCGWEEDIIE